MAKMTRPRQLCGCRSAVVVMMAYGCIAGMLQAANAAVPPAALVGFWHGIYWPDPQQSGWIKCITHSISADGAIYQAVQDHCAYPTEGSWKSCLETLEDCEGDENFAQLLDVSTVDSRVVHGGQTATYYQLIFAYTIAGGGGIDCALVYADDTQMLWFVSDLGRNGADTSADAKASCPVLTSSSSSGRTTVLHASRLANMTKQTSTPGTDASWTNSDSESYDDGLGYPGLKHFYLPGAMLALAWVLPAVAFGLVAGALLIHMRVHHKLKVKHRAAFGDAGGLVDSVYQEARNWHRAQLILNSMTWTGYIILMGGLYAREQNQRYGCFVPGIILFSSGWVCTVLVGLCSACTGLKASKYLSRKAQCSPSTLVAALKQLQAMPVDIQATIECYHMETVTSYINNTSVQSQLPVTTFTAKDHLKLASCVDRTGDADALSHITECTRVRIVVCCVAADEVSAAEYKKLGLRLERAYAQRDDFHTVTYTTLVNGKAEHCYLVAPTSGWAVCMVSNWVYLLFVLVSWNWIYLMWVDGVSHGMVIKLRKRYKVLSDAPSGAPPVNCPSEPPV